MCLHRCLLIACVMLSHACDSKQPAPPMPGSGSDSGSFVRPADAAAAAEPPTIQLDGTVPSGLLFELLKAKPLPQFVLRVRGGTGIPLRYSSTALADGPGMIVSMSRDGTLELWSAAGTYGTSGKPALVTKLDERGKSALRATLADISARTGARAMDVMIDRSQRLATLAELLQTVRATADGKPLFADVRVIAGIPSLPSRMWATIEDPGMAKAIHVDKHAVERCRYAATGGATPTEGHHLTVELDVGKDPKVAGVNVAGDAPRELLQCLSASVFAWTVRLAPGKHHVPIQVQVE